MQPQAESKKEAIPISHMSGATFGVKYFLRSKIKRVLKQKWPFDTIQPRDFWKVLMGKLPHQHYLWNLIGMQIIWSHPRPTESHCLELSLKNLPPSIGFSRQEYWSGLPFPPPGFLPNPGIKSTSPSLAGGFFNH